MCKEFKNDIKLNSEIRKWKKDPIALLSLNYIDKTKRGIDYYEARI